MASAVGGKVGARHAVPSLCPSANSAAPRFPSFERSEESRFPIRVQEQAEGGIPHSADSVRNDECGVFGDF